MREPSYAEGPAVRRVRTNGVIKWAGDLIFVSEALIGEPVAIEKTEVGEWLGRYADVELGFIDKRAVFAAGNCRRRQPVDLRTTLRIAHRGPQAQQQQQQPAT